MEDEEPTTLGELKLAAQEAEAEVAKLTIRTPVKSEDHFTCMLCHSYLEDGFRHPTQSPQNECKTIALRERAIALRERVEKMEQGLAAPL